MKKQVYFSYKEFGDKSSSKIDFTISFDFIISKMSEVNRISLIIFAHMFSLTIHILKAHFNLTLVSGEEFIFSYSLKDNEKTEIRKTFMD